MIQFIDDQDGIKILMFFVVDSEEDVTRRVRREDSEEGGMPSQGSYRSLLHENMSLLDKLRQQEDLCRALETQMGDLDSKMDNVADQHLRTLGKTTGSRCWEHTGQAKRHSHNEYLKSKIRQAGGDRMQTCVGEMKNFVHYKYASQNGVSFSTHYVLIPFRFIIVN